MQACYNGGVTWVTLPLNHYAVVTLLSCSASQRACSVHAFSSPAPRLEIHGSPAVHCTPQTAQPWVVKTIRGVSLHWYGPIAVLKLFSFILGCQTNLSGAFQGQQRWIMIPNLITDLSQTHTTV